MSWSWIGVDFDGTLATSVPGQGLALGQPIAAMVERVRQWVAEGTEVRILTARAAVPEQVALLQGWLRMASLPALQITDRKDFGLRELWDDRAIQVERNTGRRMA